MADAIRQFIPDELTGAIKLQFVDAQSGLEIPLSQLLDYNILTENGLGDLIPVNAGTSAEKTPTPSGLDISSLGNPAPRQPTEELLASKGEGSDPTRFTNNDPRTTSNNFGYVNKPGIMGLTNNIPGPIGIGSRVANGMINNNNAVAASTARTSLGLPASTGMQIAKDTVRDNRGQVADVNVNDNTYSVGLESQTKDGRTTLNPAEARQRSAMAGVAVTEATPAQSAENVSKFNKDPGTSRQGFLGRTFDSLMGKETAAPLSQVTPTLDSTPGVGPTAGVTRSGLAPLANPLQASVAPTQSPQKAVPSSTASFSPTKVGLSANGRGLLGQPSSTPQSPITQAATAVKSPTATPASYSPTQTKAANTETTGLATPASVNMSTVTSGAASRNQVPTSDVANRVADSVGKTLGAGWSVDVTSGMGKTREEKAGTKKPSGRHTSGDAIDFTLTDPTGKIVNAYTDPDVMSNVATGLAADGLSGIGVYGAPKGKFSGGHIHADVAENRATSWGVDATAGQNVDSYVDAGRRLQDKTIPTPTTRPTEPGTAIASSIAPGVTTNKGLASMVNSDMSKQRVGALQNQGFAPSYSDQEVNTMAAALAGELDPSTQRGLMVGDPKAEKEAASVVSVMSNRIGAKGLGAVTDPSQFNAFSTKPINGQVPMVNTKANFTKFGDALIDTVRNVVSGQIQSPMPDATNYANLSISSPDWGGALSTKVGFHTFGDFDKRYAAKKTPAAIDQENRARQAVANFSDYSGVARQEQAADRKPTISKDAPTTGLGSKVSATTKTESTKSTGATKSSNDSKGSGSKNASSTSTSKSTSKSSSTSKGSGGAGTKNSTSASTGVGAKSSSKSTSSSKGGSNKSSSKNSSSSSKSSSSGAKGAAGARS